MYLKNLKINFVTLLVFFFPVSIVSGPLIPEIIVFILFFFVVSDIFVYKNYSYLKNKIFFGFVLFFFYLQLVSFLSFLKYENLYSFKNTIFYFRYGIILYATIYVLENNLKVAKKFFLGYFILFLILFFDLLKQVITGINFFNMPLLHSRASSFFGDELVLDSFLIKVLPILVSLSLFLKKKNIYILFIIILFGVAIFFGGSRSSFFSYLLFVISLFLIFFKNKMIFFLFFIIILILTSLGSYNTSAGNRIFKATIDQILPQKNKLVLFSVRHQSHYETALSIFKDNLIFGAGPNQFRYLCQKENYLPIVTLKNFFIFAPSEPLVKIFLVNINEEKIDISYLFHDNNEFDTKMIFNLLKANSNFNYKNFNTYKVLISITSKNKTDYILNHYLFDGQIFYASTNYVKNQIIIKLNKEYNYANGCNTHPHNFHIQLLAEIGIIGYSFILIFLIYIIKNLYFNFRNKLNVKFYNEQYILTVGILINFFPFIPTGNFFNNWISFLLFLPLGYLISFKRIGKLFKD